MAAYPNVVSLEMETFHMYVRASDTDGGGDGDGDGDGDCPVSIIVCLLSGLIWLKAPQPIFEQVPLPLSWQTGCM